MLFEPEFIIYVDGASRGNPGHASYGFAIFNRNGDLIYEGGEYIGIATNNTAEYTALIKALEFALSRRISAVEIRTDSQLLARQLTGQYKVRSPHLEALYKKCMQLLLKFEWFEIRHVPREQNRIADRLANEALDRLKL